MVIIQKQAKLIKYIVGEQQLDTNLKYRLLNFCVLVDYNNKKLLFNNLTKELLLLSLKEVEILKSKEYIIDDPIVQLLIRKWFLVPTDNDDLALSNQITKLAKNLQNNKIINMYDIVTTTACNARCFYCFEAGVKSVTMSEETAVDVANYILKNFHNNVVKINWFGGEPLCNKNVINIISQILKKNNINYMSAITSNGYLFDDSVISDAVNLWNLKRVQITLDGMKSTYNRVKNYKNNDNNAFERVVDNIGKILNSGISVNIRLNVDAYNINEIYSLIDLLYKKYGDFRHFGIYAQLLYENTGYIKKTKSDEERINISNAYMKLCAYIEKLGISIKLPNLEKQIKTNFCIADSPNGVLISPQGKIGNCERFVGSNFGGNIYSDKIIEPWNEYCNPIYKCNKCAYFPSCMRLSDCPNCSHECYDYEQQKRLQDLEKRIKNAYDNYINNITDDIAEDYSC